MFRCKFQSKVANRGHCLLYRYSDQLGNYWYQWVSLQNLVELHPVLSKIIIIGNEVTNFKKWPTGGTSVAGPIRKSTDADIQTCPQGTSEWNFSEFHPSTYQDDHWKQSCKLKIKMANRGRLCSQTGPKIDCSYRIPYAYIYVVKRTLTSSTIHGGDICFFSMKIGKN